MILETKRLSLRPFQRGDLNTLANLFANEDFMRFSGSAGYLRAQTAGGLEKLLRWNDAGLPSQFALVERAGGRLFGYCGFLHQEVDGTAEIEIGLSIASGFLAARFGH